MELYFRCECTHPRQHCIRAFCDCFLLLQSLKRACACLSRTVTDNRGADVHGMCSSVAEWGHPYYADSIPKECGHVLIIFLLVPRNGEAKANPAPGTAIGCNYVSNSNKVIFPGKLVTFAEADIAIHENGVETTYRVKTKFM